MRVLSLVGARPQIIKEAVLHLEFRKRGIREILVHSGQHYDYNMSDVFFEVLGIRKPDYNLGVGSDTHARMTARIMMAFEEVLLKERPDVVIVYGDTNTTLAGALTAAKLKIPVAHVEAGIRQKPKDMPEEINRVITDRVSTLLFAPSKLAVENLKKEGIEEGVHFTGDVMYDLFLMMRDRFDFSIVRKLGLKENDYVVVTIHRDFNTDDPSNLSSIIYQLEKIARDMRVIFPIHPRTRKRLKEFGLEERIKRVEIIDPLDYLSMMGLICRSKAVITDSGGLQKEAYFCKKRAVVVMPDTGWRELIEMGWNVLSKPGSISQNFVELLSKRREHIEEIYGNGKSRKKIVNFINNMKGR